jgi:vitamin B12 transporter
VGQGPSAIPTCGRNARAAGKWIEQSLLDGQVTLAAVYFDQQFTDLVEYTFARAADASTTSTSAAPARMGRAPTAPLATAISVTVRYTFLSTRVTDPGFDPGPGTALAAGERLLRRPPHAAFARLAWAPTRRVTAGAEARWVGGWDDLDFAGFPFARVHRAAYGLVGLSAAVDLSGAGRPGVVLRARADNLFDTPYEEVRGFRTPGRTLFVGAEARFPS